MSGGEHFLQGKIGDLTIVQTSSGVSVYVFDEKSGAVIKHFTRGRHPFNTVEEMMAACAEIVKKTEERAKTRNPCETCRKKHRCPKVCYPRRDYERAIGKRGGRKHDL